MLFFWFFMLVIDLLLPLTMVLLGRRFLQNPPDRANDSWGYRTVRSMKSNAAWQFAQEHWGSLAYRMGLILMPLSVIPLLFFIGADEKRIGMVGAVICLAQAVPFVASLIPTELALKKNFDKNGKPRS